MIASKAENATLITNLLKAGANYSLRDHHGHTVFDMGKYIITAIEPVGTPYLPVSITGSIIHSLSIQ
jgi:hypothetical protein